MTATRRHPTAGPVLAAVGGLVMVGVLVTVTAVAVGDWFGFPDRTIWTTRPGSEELDLTPLQATVDGVGLGPLVLTTLVLAAVVGASYLISLLTGTMRRRTLRGTQLAFAVSLVGFVALATRLLVAPPTELGITGPKEVAIQVLEVTGDLTPSVYGLVGLFAAALTVTGVGVDLLARRGLAYAATAALPVEVGRPDGSPVPAEARRAAAR